MTRVYQTRGGRKGNCWPACLASLLEIPLEDVDHCSMENDNAIAKTQAFLAERGLFYIEIEIPERSDELARFPFTDIPKGVLAIGGDATGILNHAVIVRADNPNPGQLAFYVIHDPHRPDGSLRESYDIRRLMFICRLFT